MVRLKRTELLLLCAVSPLTARTACLPRVATATPKTGKPRPERLQELTRRAFIFSAFTGLSYVDVKRLYPSHIGTTADGRRFIRINRKKTDVESFIPLHPVAEQILLLYNTTDDGRPVFPLPNRNRLWYCIHEIGILAGVKENLSYHASRHSFGTLTLSAGVPIPPG